MANTPQAAAATQAASRLHDQEAKRLIELQGFLQHENDDPVLMLAARLSLLACVMLWLYILLTALSCGCICFLRPGHAVALSAALTGFLAQPVMLAENTLCLAL